MKVRYAASFDELDLRTVRAAIGRGGKATRKECVVFIDRAVRAALKAAPDPKPARTPRSKGPSPTARPVVENEEQATIEQRNRIASLYKHEVKPPSYETRKALREATLAVGRA